MTVRLNVNLLLYHGLHHYRFRVNLVNPRQLCQVPINTPDNRPHPLLNPLPLLPRKRYRKFGLRIKFIDHVAQIIKKHPEPDIRGQVIIILRLLRKISGIRPVDYP